MGTTSRLRLAAVLTTLLVALLLLLQACNRSGSPTPTPRAGGVLEESAAALAEPQPTPSPTPVLFAVGDAVRAPAQLSLYADVTSASSVLEVYDAGVEFTVMEPTARFDGYPVVSGGASWVRLRAPDGLAGWARADGLTP